MDSVSNQYRHGKTILAIGASKARLERTDVLATLANREPDPGILMGAPAEAERAVEGFIAAPGRHRHPEREAGAPAP